MMTGLLGLNFLNRSCFAWAAGIAGVGLVSYAIYFDKQRCSAPDYKQKIRQNRKLKEHACKRSATANIRPFPNPSDEEAMQQYFFDEIVSGEELLKEGNLEEGAIHTANAVFASGRPQEMLQLLEQTLPMEHFEAVVEAIPVAKTLYLNAVRSNAVVADASVSDDDDDDGEGEEKEVSGSRNAIVDGDDLE